MMSDFTWLATEAKQIHQLFEGLFFSIVGTFLVLGIVLEYFKFTLGGVPTFLTLVGRALVASLLLVSFPEVLNTVASLTDKFAAEIGSLNQFELVLDKMGDQMDKLSWSWISVKRMVIVSISFIAFFLLYISVYLTNALYIFTWTLLYIFSPMLIACFVLPQTSGITKNLYKSLFIVASWKIMWVTLAAILWSSALIDLEHLSSEANFLTICIFNLMLAFSLLFTPFVANSFINTGLASMSPKLGTAAVMTMGSGIKHTLKFLKDRFKGDKDKNSFNARRFNKNRRNKNINTSLHNRRTKNKRRS